DEFLAEPLRRELRALAARDGVNGYLFRWPLWNGRRYFTEALPYRLAMFRRDRVRWVGIVHAMIDVDPPVEHVELQIEHRPAYNNWSLRSVLTKWRPRARVAARQYLMDLAEIPYFGWTQPPAWPPRRRLLNRLSPLLFLPYMPVAFLALLYRGLFRYGNRYGLLTNLRLSLYEGIYAGMLQFYVARYQYLGAGRDVQPAPQGDARPRDSSSARS